MDAKFKPFWKLSPTWMRHYEVGETLDNVSVGAGETVGPGGMVAINPENEADQWWVSAEYFETNFLTEIEADGRDGLRESHRDLTKVLAQRDVLLETLEAVLGKARAERASVLVLITRHGEVHRENYEQWDNLIAQAEKAIEEARG